MKNRVRNSLNYTGIVTLSSYKGTKKVKVMQVLNAGDSQLFEFLADCFLGELERAMPKRPAKIKLLHISDTGVVESASSGFIGLLSQPSVSIDATQCSITYSFLIPRDQLESMTSMTDLGLGLYSSQTLNSEEDIYKYIASCRLEDLPTKLTTTDILASSSLVVDWELIISNSAKS